jgi:predicted AlkP superfamily pyrophosphatase or phosphodiesterase
MGAALAVAAAYAQSTTALAGSGGVNRNEHLDKPYVVLVSFDGFGAQYLDRFRLPNFQRLIQGGTRAKSLQPVFPSLTFPNHYSIVTGLYAEQHGIVGMEFIDPARGQTFLYTETSADGSWYRGEPVWVTAEKQGMVAATCFWPGSDAAIQGVRPTYWKRYDGSLPNSARVQQILDWLSLPGKQRPHFLSVYFSDVDSVGHRAGPGSAELAAAVQQADQLLGSLLDGIDGLPIRNRVAIVVVSDHGMTKVSREETIPIENLIDLSGLKGTGAGSQMNLFESPEFPAARIRDTVNARIEHGRAYLRSEIPERFHYRSDPRIGDVVIIMDEPWRLLPPKGGTRDMRVLGGWHGWDPGSPAMQGIFLAMGPGIGQQVQLDTFEAVQVYPFLTALLRLEPAAGAVGRPAWLDRVLKR